MGEVAPIAKKYRRALRNEQGTRFTADELRQLADMGMLEMLQQAEGEELQSKWAGKAENMSSGASGSPRARNRPSTRSPGMTKKAELRGIEALVANG